MGPSTRRASASVSFAFFCLMVVLVSPAGTSAQTISVLAPFADVLRNPVDLVADSFGNVYVAGSDSDNLFQVATDGTVTLIASRDSGLPATFARPQSLAVDSQDNLYVACADSDNVFRFASGGGVSVVLDATGDGLGNGLDGPETLAVDSSDTLFVAGFDSDNVFSVSSSGSVALVMDATGLGPTAPLDQARVTESRGEVFILGFGEVFRISGGGVLTEVIGPAGDGVVSFGNPTALEVNTGGDVLVTDGPSVFAIPPTGLVAFAFAPFFGDVDQLASDSLGSTWVSSSGGTTLIVELPAVGSPITHVMGGAATTTYQSVAADDVGNVYWVQQQLVASDWVFKRTPSGTITPIMGQLGASNGDWLLNGGTPLILADGTVHVAGRASDNLISISPIDGPALTIGPPDWSLGRPEDIHVGQTGEVLVAGGISDTVVRFDLAQGTAEQLIDQNGDGLGNSLDNPQGVTTDTAGNVWVSGLNTDNLFRISPSGVITEMIDSTGSGGEPLDDPSGLAIDTQDNVYVAGTKSDNVFKVTPDGVVTTIIGSDGDGLGNGLDGPDSVAVDGAGNVYVTGRNSDNVFSITPGGVITQIMNTSGAGVGAELFLPKGIAVGWFGDVYVAGTTSDNVLHRTPGGTITEIIDQTGDGLGNELDGPVGIAVDAFGTVYVTGVFSDNVFRIDPVAGISQVVESTGAGLIGPLDGPVSVALDASGNLYVGSNKGEPVLLQLTQDEWWEDLGGAAPGIFGHPEMRCKGPLSGGSSMDRVLTRVPPNALMLAWISFASTPLNAVGGTVHAFPPAIQFFFMADGTGQSSLSVTWPAGQPSGIEVYLQFIVQDLSVPSQLTLSNAMVKTTP